MTNPDQTVLLIYNPVAGAARYHHVTALIDQLESRGLAVDLRPTTAVGDARQFAAEATSAAYRALLVVGGDGTFNEVINGLAREAPPLIIVARGTANTLALELRMPKSMAEIAKLVTGGAVSQIYVGAVNGQQFSMMAGVGFDAHVVAGVSKGLKRIIGKAAYGVEAFRQLVRYKPVVYDIEIDGNSYKAASMIVANGHYYGGKFIVAPDAKLESDHLYACLFERPGRWNLLRYALNLALGRHHKLPDVRILKARTISINGFEGEPVQLDGDPRATLPAQICLHPDKVRMIYPKA